MAILPTMRIVSPGSSDDYIVINECDFDPDLHEQFVEKPAVDDPLIVDLSGTNIGIRTAAIVADDPLAKLEAAEIHAVANLQAQKVHDEIMDNELPPVTHEIAKNGQWKVFRYGEVIKKGRGKPSLNAFLETVK